MIRAEDSFEFPILAEKSVSISVKTFFFFGEHLFLGGKTASISDFGRKIRVNFGSVVSLFQKIPPFFSKSWLRACLSYRLKSETLHSLV